VLLLGTNVAATMPPFIGHLTGAQDAGGLIVVDPRRTATARLTDEGRGIHVQPTPGTDLALLLGLTHVVISEGFADAAYLAARTDGFDDLRRSVAGWWPERVQSVTGVPAATIRTVARRLAAGGGVYILTGRGVEQHVDGTDTATAAINLALVLGLPGAPDSGYGTLTGQGNGQGGREHGQKCDQLPGYRKITDPAARAHVAAVWGVDPAVIPGAGIPAVELLQALGTDGGPKALMVHGSNVVVSAPNASTVRAGLERLDLLVVSDFFLSETAALADVVLPVPQWAEEEGTMTNLEGRVIRRRRALAPPAGVRDELWIMAELARRLDAPGTYSVHAREVFDELRRASAGGIADYSGIDDAMLDAGAPVHWPCPVGSRGTPRLFGEEFGHPDGRARIVAVSPAVADARLPGPGELTLITGRLLEHYQSGAQTRRVPELALAQPGVRATLHPVAAERYGIADGDTVELSNDRGVMHARALVSRDVRPGDVFVPFHFGGDGTANLLTSDAVDPVSAMPEFKTGAVRVRRVEEAVVL
jgi:assimilatory nitrate reductase catalytic subunit